MSSPPPARSTLSSERSDGFLSVSGNPDAAYGRRRPPQRGSAGLKPSDRDPERRARYIIEPYVVEEVDGLGITSVLAAHPQVKLGPVRRPSSTAMRTRRPTPSTSRLSKGETVNTPLLR